MKKEKTAVKSFVKGKNRIILLAAGIVVAAGIIIIALMNQDVIKISGQAQSAFEITVGQESGDLTGNTNVVLQEAVDKVAEAGGGTVRILPGKYIMNDSLHLKAGVNLIGSGDKTILYKPASVESEIIYYQGYGHYDVSVANPEKFEAGMGVYISDDLSEGFYSTVATVLEKNGSELVLSRKLNADCIPWKNGKAISVYPVISGCNIKNASVSDITIDGNAGENTYLHGMRGGGIFLLQAHDIKINNVVVNNYNGDGISFQACKNTLVENSICTGNKGYGIHPGSGSVGDIVRNCEFTNNEGDGVFYCVRVTYSLLEGCTIEGNGRNGVSIGMRDTDSIIRNNVIKNNKLAGILIKRDSLNQAGHRTLIEENRFSGNAYVNAGQQSVKGQISITSAVSDVHITRNVYENAEGVKSNVPLIYVGAQTERVYAYENDPGEYSLLGSSSMKVLDGYFNMQPEESLSVGPDNIPETAWKHLGNE